MIDMNANQNGLDLGFDRGYRFKRLGIFFFNQDDKYLEGRVVYNNLQTYDPCQMLISLVGEI